MAESMEVIGDQQPSTSNLAGPSSAYHKKPVCLIVLGMAGSGKTSLVSRLSTGPKKPYVVNLDPACFNLPYQANIDIRDTISYKDIMKQYKLGPNGAIVTSLNLFSTKFGEIMNYIAKTPYEYCVLDTPGQIEVFTWSISGSIITEALAKAFPTVILYVLDTARSTSPVTFMSNMLYACSILYKTKLPFIVVMNKIDVVDHQYALDWMNDFECFTEALEGNEDYISSFTRTMALTLSTFYENLKVCGVSAATGDGIHDLYQAVEEAREEYEKDFRPELDKMRAEAEAKKLSEEMDDLEINTIAGSKDLTDVFLRLPFNEDSSSDSEGEEAPFEEAVDSDKDDDDATFKKVLQQQREMQVKRAKEAEERKRTQNS